MTEAICAALLDRLATGTRASSETPRQCCRRCRTAVELSTAGMCQVGARVYFLPGCGRLQSAFEEQEWGQKRRASARYHHGDPTCMWYRCDSLPGPDPGGTLAIDLKDGDDFSCSGDKIYRLGSGRPCVFANAGVRHRRQVGQVQGSSSHSQ